MKSYRNKFVSAVRIHLIRAGLVTEGIESFFLNLSNPTNATIADSQGVGTISQYVAPATVTLDVQESRLSGTAPLAIFFDASGTTSTQTTRPIHDVQYGWDFGDTSAGTWTNGTNVHTNKNVAFGHVASHVFETPGTYTVTATAYDGVSTDLKTKTIIVADPNVTWAGTKTICYSTGAAPVAGVNGVPTGAVCVGGVTDLAASIAANIGASGNTRHLLKAGDTFPISSQIMIDKGGPSMIGKFGTGANPIINSLLSASAAISLSRSTTPTGVSDWVFQDFTIDCNNMNNGSAFAGNGSCSRILMNRVYLTRCGYGLLLSGSTLNALNGAVSYTHAMWDQFYLVNSTIYDLYTSASGPNAIFGSCDRGVVMGCNINNNSNGEHGIRFQYLNRGVINNNTIQGIAPGKVNLTVRGAPYAGSVTQVGPVYSEKIVMSDNYLVGGASVGMVGFGPQNGTSDERGRDFIFERNFLLGTSSVTNMILSSQQDITFRNNLINLPAGGGGGFAFGVQPSGIVPNPTRNHVYNNIVYHGGSSNFRYALFWVAINNDASPFDQTMPGSTFEVKNNILYTPNHVSDGWYTMLYKDPAAQSVTTASNNTADANLQVNPQFNTTPPTAVAHFIPSSASYAQNSGVAVNVWKDFYGAKTDATPDMGAFKI